MDKKLYDIVYNAITTQFGAGDYIENGDREACAEQIVEDLKKAGYRNIGEAWVDEKDLKGDTLADVIERAIGEIDRVRKETAKEIFKEVVKLLDEAVPHTKEFTTLLWLAGQIKTKYGIEVDE